MFRLIARRRPACTASMVVATTRASALAMRCISLRRSLSTAASPPPPPPPPPLDGSRSHGGPPTRPTEGRQSPQPGGVDPNRTHDPRFKHIDRSRENLYLYGKT